MFSRSFFDHALVSLWVCLLLLIIFNDQGSNVKMVRPTHMNKQYDTIKAVTPILNTQLTRSLRATYANLTRPSGDSHSSKCVCVRSYAA